jgi:hypothetical protein
MDTRQCGGRFRQARSAVVIHPPSRSLVCFVIAASWTAYVAYPESTRKRCLTCRPAESCSFATVTTRMVSTGLHLETGLHLVLAHTGPMIGFS